MNSSNWPISNVWVFIVQLVKHCSANEETIGSNPVGVPILFVCLFLFLLRFVCLFLFCFVLFVCLFFGLICHCLSCTYHCDDHIFI